ncbi:MAG: NADH:ubiquinone reductase (Na(+)-transporting) subunit C, partial [Salibacteraceae bacterium]|nr:NADH:ubiquinone reductase (Na(+)-transporting) subunit C [Salibacteraceae bacterium]
MAINKESQVFTLVFTLVMVVVVATVLSLTALGLKEPQDENMKQETMQSILASIQVKKERSEAGGVFT